MPVELEDVRLAAGLVALGFPGDHSHYAELRPAALERFRTDPAFRRLCDVLARGQGLVLIDVTPGGDVVLAAERGTPFTPVVDTLLPGHAGIDDRRRQLAVLALLAVVAEVFPSEDALAAVDESLEVLPSEVVQLLLSRAEAVAREPAAAASGREAELRQAFAAVREVQPSVPTRKTGREGALGLEGVVTSVLRELAGHALLREVRAGDRVAFRPTAALAGHVRYLLEREAVDEALDGLRAARAAARAADGSG